MPTTIPYDPSLVLGNLVHPGVLNNLIQIADLQSQVDSAQDALNSLIATKHSFRMTIQELINLNINTSNLITEEFRVDERISKAAEKYAEIKIKNEDPIRALKENVLGIHASIESPIDYNKSVIKTDMPLSANSLKMDCQYFSYDENKQSSDSTISSIKSYINGSVQSLGHQGSGEISNAAMSQINTQRENHDISGTLIITATCTHKNAVLIAPFILNVDKAIRTWNSMYSGDKKINMNDPASVRKIAMEEGTDNESSLSIISGATYGSCFIGMVHIVKSESTESYQSMLSKAESAQGHLEIGSWFASYSGNNGVDSSFSSDVKRLLSTASVRSHANLITMGLIPSIKSSEVKTAVKEFKKFDPDSTMKQLAVLATATINEKKTVSSAAESARTGGQMKALEATKIESVMSEVGKMDEVANKVIDVTTLMNAFDDYVEKASSGDIGVPINYYIKNITRNQLAQMWVSKYYPGEFLTESGDDSDYVPKKSAAATTQE